MQQVKPRAKEKTIKMTLGFLTRGIAPKKGMIRPKHAWGVGWIALEANGSHGIASAVASFNSLAEIPAALEKLLIKGGIKIHLVRRQAKLFVP
jgi:hypothetical protein